MTGGLRELARWSPPAPEIAPPDAPVPGGVIDDPRMPAIAERLRTTPRIGPAPLSPHPAGGGRARARTGGWLQFKGDQPVDAAALAFFCDAWWPAAHRPD